MNLSGDIEEIKEMKSLLKDPKQLNCLPQWELFKKEANEFLASFSKAERAEMEDVFAELSTLNEEHFDHPLVAIFNKATMVLIQYRLFQKCQMLFRLFYSNKLTVKDFILHIKGIVESFETEELKDTSFSSKELSHAELAIVQYLVYLVIFSYQKTELDKVKKNLEEINNLIAVEMLFEMVVCVNFNKEVFNDTKGFEFIFNPSLFFNKFSQQQKSIAFSVATLRQELFEKELKFLLAILYHPRLKNDEKFFKEYKNFGKNEPPFHILSKQGGEEMYLNLLPQLNLLKLYNDWKFNRNRIEQLKS